MDFSQFISEFYRAFEDIPRPERFIRGTCFCDECVEHNQTLAAADPATIAAEVLDNPGWDPICFASDQAFVYYLPALIRLTLTGEYAPDQLSFHLTQPDRLQALTVNQRQALLQVVWALVWALVALQTQMVPPNQDLDALEAIIQALEALP